MPRPCHAEVPPVNGCDLGDAEAFGCYDNRGIDCAERQVVVLRDQLDHPKRIGRMDRLKHEGTVGEVAEEAGLCRPAESRP
jgi:hypothetical protein